MTSSMSPADVEFLAENEFVKIIPNFTMKSLCFISGEFGPFLPQRPVKVPLWFAVILKIRQRCKIHPPEWLEVDKLQEIVEQEKNDERYFCPLPFHYMEIALLILENASDDMKNPVTVRTLLQDLRDLRLSKVKSSIYQIEGTTTALQMDNLGLMEINELRSFLGNALDELYLMRETSHNDES